MTLERKRGTSKRERCYRTTDVLGRVRWKLERERKMLESDTDALNLERH